MARVTYVKKAQPRYFTKAVIDPETGRQKQTPVMKKNGEQKTTKTGRLVFLSVTENDLSRPKPNRKCDKCGVEIKVGDPYKHVTTRSTYGGTTRIRCGTCPEWQVWELSQSMGARLQQIAYDFHANEPFESPDDVASALESAADEIRSLAEEKRESASNIEEGFGHETSLSQELSETADSLESWADEVAGAEVPDLPDVEEDDCEECDGTGSIVGDVADEPEEDCEQCNGTGRYTPDEPTDEQMDEWRDEVESAVSIVDESPV